MFNNITTSKSR